MRLPELETSLLVVVHFEFNRGNAEMLKRGLKGKNALFRASAVPRFRDKVETCHYLSVS